MIEAVYDLTKMDFERVFRMPFADFSTYMQYLRIKAEKQYMQQKKEEARLRAMRRK